MVAIRIETADSKLEQRDAELVAELLDLRGQFLSLELTQRRVCRREILYGIDRALALIRGQRPPDRTNPLD